MLKTKLLGRGNFDGSVGEQTNLIEFFNFDLCTVYIYLENRFEGQFLHERIVFVKKEKKVPCVAYKCCFTWICLMFLNYNN